MRTTMTWICLLGFASAAAIAACGGDDDDGGGGPGGGSAGASGGGSAGSGAGGTAGGAGSTGGSLRMQLTTLCQERCTDFDALNCAREDPIVDCDRSCTQLANDLTPDCLTALVADYQCVKGLGRDAYECNEQGKPAVASDRRTCQPAAEDVVNACGRLDPGEAGGAGGQGGSR